MVFAFFACQSSDNRCRKGTRFYIFAMRYAIFSDLHDSLRGLELVLADAQRRQVDRLLCLGDVGHSAKLFEALRLHEIPCLFGNWEVSGYRRLPAPLAQEVGQWPGFLVIESDQTAPQAAANAVQACCCHATPDIPPEVQTTAAAERYMRRGLGWNKLFPRLHSDETARWNALAALETRQIPVAFHGHTHLQQLWSYGADGPVGERGRAGPARWQAHTEPELYALADKESGADVRYLIGVGSAGQPMDGPHPRYAIYDAAAHTVELCQIASRL